MSRTGWAGWTRAWWLLLAASVGVIVAVDTARIALVSGYFGAGFNGIHLDTPAELAAFFLGSALLDTALVLGIWAFAVPLLGRLPTTRLQTFALAGMVAVGLPLLLSAIRYNVHRVLGITVSPSVLWEIGRGSASEVAMQAVDQLASIALLAAGAAAGVALVLVLARRVEGRFAMAPAGLAPPPGRTLWIGFLTLLFLATLLLVAVSVGSDRLRFGLFRKSSSTVFVELIERVSDVDGDDFGLLSRPRDPDPFDASIHPYAIDLPDNGIDENGLAGDHPGGFEPPSAVEVQEWRGTRTPHLLLIFLESFRADLLGAALGGREITPFLNRLAREGAASSHAYVHTPFTVVSRGQLFGGRLVPRPGQTTLIDDFKDRGYTVAYFSGQDDSYGGSEALVGTARADHFYDARRDRDRRTSRSAAPVSLQVSWKTVNQRVMEFLDGVDPATPLFLYVNFVDTHFPYHHDEIENLLGTEPLSRRQIRSDRVQQVWEAYANTAANVDRAIEELVVGWRRVVGEGDQAIVVVADHGQVFYEGGLLGHGQSLDDAVTRTPLILWGIGGEWPEPLGLADLRGLLRRHLGVASGEGTPRARFRVAPERRILQYAALIEHPVHLGQRGIDGAMVYDFRGGELRVWGADGRRIELEKGVERDELRSLVRDWEALRLKDWEALRLQDWEALRLKERSGAE